jgi:hypothetical protein
LKALGVSSKSEIKYPSIDNNHLRPAIVRIMESGAQALPHDDHPFSIHFDIDQTTRLLAQLGANIYLSMSGDGGDLKIFNKRLTKAEYDSKRNSKLSYGVDLTEECESISVSPRQGDLILFNTANLHAITPIRTGVRVTISMFIAMFEDSSIFVWS